MDAYLIAVSLPMTMAGLISGVLNYQLVPALQYAESEHAGSDGLIRSLVVGFVGGAAIVALVGIVAADQIYFILNPSLSLVQHAAAVELAHITWIYLPLSVSGAIYIAGLHMRQQFAVATILLSAPIMGSIVVCLLAQAQLGIKATAWGQLLGYVIMFGGLRVAYGGVRSGWDWAGLRRVMSEFPRALAAVLIFVFYPFSDAFWGSRIGPAAVSYLGYAQRLLIGFSGLAVVGLTTVLFPRLARHAAEGKGDALRQDLGASIRVMLVCMVPGATAFGMLGTPSLQLLFQRGSFQLADAVALGRLLPVMLGGMVAMSCTGLVFKALFARREAGVAGALSITGAIVYFTLSGFLGPRLGVKGIGVAYLASWWLVLGLGMGYIWREVSFAALVRAKFRFFAHLGAAVFLVALVCWLGILLLPVETSPYRSLRLLIVSATWTLAGAAYVAVGGLLPALTELNLIRQKILLLASKRRPVPKC